jgi:CRISPR-associated protein Cas8c/Csp2
MSFSPLSGEFLSFSQKGGISRGLPKSTLFDIALSTITTLTPFKPCMQDKGSNTAIIPDLPLEEMIGFIRFFKDMLSHKTLSELFVGRVKRKSKGNKENPIITYKPLRPLLFSGNFPNPPKSTALGGIALLATIGEFSKESEFSVRAEKVLNSLKETTMYLVKYGNAHTFTYNHYIIELAKNGNLRQIVDSIYYSKLYNQPDNARWDYKNTEYQKFDLFTSRFLQLFNTSSFKDFLSFRAEYPYQLEILFNTYFIKMEKIDSKIVASARQLGKWLNQVAYFTAKAEIKEGSPNYWEKLREIKAKVLIELESAAFSAKSGDALMAQVITRAGRLSMMDVPSEADLFIESAMNGELTLEQSKNLVIAFSRLSNRSEKEDSKKEQEQLSENNKENYQNI